MNFNNQPFLKFIHVFQVRAKWRPYQDTAANEHILEGRIKAGLPDNKTDVSSSKPCDEARHNDDDGDLQKALGSDHPYVNAHPAANTRHVWRLRADLEIDP